MNNKPEQEPQIFLKLSGGVIQLSLSTFNNTLEREITKFILENDTYKTDIFNLNELKKNVKYWRSKYKKLYAEAQALDKIAKRLKRDLEEDKFAKPIKCSINSIGQNVNIKPNYKLKMASAHRNSNKEPDIITILDSEDEIVISDMSKTKQQIKNENIIDLIDSDNDTQNGDDKVPPISTELVKSLTIEECMSTSSLRRQKPGPKSKRISVDDTVIDLIDSDNDTQNGYDKVPPISTELVKSLTIEECMSTSSLRRQKPGPKSKRISVDDTVIDLIDSDNDTQNGDDKVPPISTELVKSLTIEECMSTSSLRRQKPGPKSKRIYVDDTVIDLIDSDNDTQNGDDKVPLISTELVKSLTIEECMSTSSLRRQKPGPKSKRISVDDTDPSDAENNKTVHKKICLNDCQVINDNKSNSTNLSVKKLEVDEMYNHNFNSKFLSQKYPPPLNTLIPPHKTRHSWKKLPPSPEMKIKTSGNKVILTWDMNLTRQTADIKKYELFARQETDALPDVSMWKKKGDIKPKLLPMACEIEVFALGFIYHFALRAVDVHNRRTPFTILKTKV